MNTDNRSIVFLTLSMLCIWVILDSVFGNKHLHVFLANVFPFYTYNGDDKKTRNTMNLSGVEFVETERQNTIQTSNPDTLKKAETVFDMMKEESKGASTKAPVYKPVLPSFSDYLNKG